MLCIGLRPPGGLDAYLFQTTMKFNQPLQPVIDLDSAREIGQRLCAARQGRQLSVGDVANLLMASDRQVIGLEHADCSCFYNTRFYAKVADKYARLLGLEETPSTMLFIADADMQPKVLSQNSVAENQSLCVAAVDGAMAEAPVLGQLRKGRSRLVLATLVMGITVCGLLALSSLDYASAVEPVLSSQTSIDPPQVQAVAEPVAVQSENPVAQGEVLLAFHAPCWVKVVPIRGNAEEKMYEAGESARLTLANLQTLIVGNVKAVELQSLEGRFNLVSLAASGNNVARVGGEQLAQVVGDLRR